MCGGKKKSSKFRANQKSLSLVVLPRKELVRLIEAAMRIGVAVGLNRAQRHFDSIEVEMSKRRAA